MDADKKVRILRLRSILSIWFQMTICANFGDTTPNEWFIYSGKSHLETHGWWLGVALFDSGNLHVNSTGSTCHLRWGCAVLRETPSWPNCLNSQQLTIAVKFKVQNHIPISAHNAKMQNIEGSTVLYLFCTMEVIQAIVYRHEHPTSSNIIQPHPPKIHPIRPNDLGSHANLGFLGLLQLRQAQFRRVHRQKDGARGVDPTCGWDARHSHSVNDHHTMVHGLRKKHSTREQKRRSQQNE